MRGEGLIGNVGGLGTVGLWDKERKRVSEKGGLVIVRKEMGGGKWK